MESPAPPPPPPPPPPPKKGFSWQVKLYQLNPSQDGGGDSAIMLLLDTSQTKNTVKWAALIDGGNGEVASSLAIRTIEQLEKKYTFADGSFAFDVVSISHWDADHWNGFARLYKTDKTIGKNLLYNSKRGFKSPPDSAGHGQHKLFKYDTTDPKASVPLTRFYCQSWERLKGSKTIGINLDSTGKSTKSGVCPVNVKPMAGNPAQKWVLDGRFETVSVLGHNMINGEGIVDAQGNPADCSTILKIEDLIKFNHPWIQSRAKNTFSPGAPGLYVWGVNGLGLGNKTPYGVFDYANNSPTPRNIGSMMLLLIWVKWNAGGGSQAAQMQDPQLKDIVVSLYSGGDAEYKPEDALAEWLGSYTGGTRNGRVQVVKAGHHGSSAGTSQEFVEAVQPDLYLLSSGTEYTHPVPEIIWYMHAYFKNYPCSSFFTKRMWLLCWPYWLGRVLTKTGEERWMSPGKGTASMIPEVFDNRNTDTSDTAKVWKALRDKMSGWYNNRGVMDQVADFTTTLTAIENDKQKYPTDDDRDAAKLQALSDKISTLLKDVAEPSGIYYPLKSQLATGNANEDKKIGRKVRIAQYVEVTFGPYGTCTDIRLVELDDVPDNNGKLAKLEKYVEPEDMDDGDDSAKSETETSDAVKDSHSASRALGVKRKYTAVCDFSTAMPDMFVMSEDLEQYIWASDKSNNAILPSQPPSVTSSLPRRMEHSFTSSSVTDVQFNFISMYPDTNAVSVPQGSNMWYFLGGLHDQIITLNTTVTTPSWQYPLAKSDEFANWIANIFCYKTSTVATTNVQAWNTGNEAVIDGFLVDVANFCGSNWNLVWTTDNTVTQFVLGSGLYRDRQVFASAIDSNGIINDSRILIMGLDFRPANRSNNVNNLNEKFSLTDVLAFIQFDSIPAALGPILSATMLDLDLPSVTDLTTQQDISDDDAVQALFFQPGYVYDTVLRMDFIDNDPALALSAFLSNLLPDWTIGSVKVKATQRSQICSGLQTSTTTQPDIQILNKGQVCLKTTICIDSKVDDKWDTYISFDEDRLSLISRWSSLSNPILSFLSWISGLMEGFKDSWYSYEQILQDWTGDNSIMQNILLRQIQLEIQWADEKPIVTSVSMTLQMNLDWGIDKVATPNGIVPFQLVFSYHSQGGMTSLDFNGSIWPRMANTPLDVLNPTSPIYQPLPPAALQDKSATYVYSLALDQLGASPDGLNRLPKGIPQTLTNLVLDVSTTDLSLSAVLQTETVTTGTITSATAPFLSLDYLELSAMVSWANAARTVDLGFLAGVTLRAPDGVDVEPASLNVELDFEISSGSSSSWTLTGGAYNLSGANIYALFPEADRDGVMNVMKDVAISNISLDYQYTVGGVGASFVAAGNLTLDIVNLEINFVMPPGMAWTFEADMTWASQPDAIFLEQTTTLQSVINSVCPTIALPDFLGNISLKVDQSATVVFACRKLSNGQTLVSLDATIKLDLDDNAVDVWVDFSFVQLSPGPSTTGQATVDPIRILKFEVSALPSLPDIPMLSSFGQPYDQMGFVWCSTDLTRAVVDVLNTEVYQNPPHSELVYRDPKNYTTDTTLRDPSNPSNDKVISAGSHLFVVVTENNTPTVIIDYQFDATTPPTAPVAQGTDAPNATTAQGGASGVLQVSKGPLVVSGLTLKYQSPNLQITFDATVKFGGLEGTLKGFGVQFNLADVFKLDLSSVTLLIDGLGLEMQETPVNLAGEVLKKGSDFFGGVSLGIEPYSFMGGGFYGNATSSNPQNPPFRTIFVFAAVEGPFVELEFASLSGLTAGFGHNSHMTLPTVENVLTFPFLTLGSASSAKDPLAVINSFTQPTASQPKPWFTDIGAKGEVWMAAGMKATAFNTLVVDAVLTVDLTASDMVIGLFADATASVPAQEQDQTKLFALADMGLLALLDWSKGIFKVEGQLTPRSFILCSDCKLKGGFALCYFFDGSGHEGDWVLTIGGYHPSFVPPSWYPVPQRVSITWVLDSTISISGEAYLAVTPKCAMGGGKLDLTYTSGSLHAWFDAYADFLINYKPFSFKADMGVTIGIEYDLAIGCITHHFHVSFGCSLHIHGPPVAGYVHVGWSIISFDIYFGNANEPTGKLDWIQFQDLIRQDAQTSSITSPPPSLIKASATNGLISSPDAAPQSQMTTADDGSNVDYEKTKWTVDHTNFAFDISTMFPLTQTTFNNSELKLPSTAIDVFGANQPLDAVSMKPMGATQNVSSHLIITINDSNDAPVAFVPSVITKNMPTAIWDTYNQADDPYLSASVSSSAFSSVNSTKPLMTGLSFSIPPPTERGPFLALDTTSNTLSYDCYSNTNPAHPPPQLPVDSDTDLQASHSSPTPIRADYQDVADQNQAFTNAANVWEKSSSPGLAAVLAGLSTALGVPPNSVQAQKMNAFAKTCGPPPVLIRNMAQNFVVPPLLSGTTTT